jgi:CRP-like cAMP-binding protein
MRSGDDIVMCLCAGSGSVLGLPAVVANKPYTATADTLPGAEVNFVSREDFIELMRTVPLLSLKVLQVLAAEVRSARQALSSS